MSYPPFDAPTDAAYDAMAVKPSDLPRPAGCHVYAPDNYDDYTCLVLWQPAPELGARLWTRNGRRILIGVYRDQGRGMIEKDDELIDTAETYVIARLLPTFKPVPWSTVLEILTECDPEESREVVALTDIRTGDVQLNSEVRPQAIGSTLYRRHRQQMNELSKPLRQVYDARGRPIPPDLRFSKHQNAPLYVTTPMTNQWDPIPTANPYLPVYDYYGFPINERRGPLHRTDIVSYDPDSPNGIKRLILGNGSEPVYSGPLFDVFGDFVVGARANNTLITRKPVQPITVDHHNTPFKTPQRRR